MSLCDHLHQVRSQSVSPPQRYMPKKVTAAYRRPDMQLSGQTVSISACNICLMALCILFLCKLNCCFLVNYYCVR